MNKNICCQNFTIPLFKLHNNFLAESQLSGFWSFVNLSCTRLDKSSDSCARHSSYPSFSCNNNTYIAHVLLHFFRLGRFLTTMITKEENFLLNWIIVVYLQGYLFDRKGYYAWTRLCEVEHFQAVCEYIFLENILSTIKYWKICVSPSFNKEINEN